MSTGGDTYELFGEGCVLSSLEFKSPLLLLLPGYVRDQYRLLNIYESGSATPIFTQDDYE